MSTCIVCGHEDGACTGSTREIVTVSGVVNQAGPMRVPKQNVRVGKAGYQGNVEVYDPKYPKLRLVKPETEELAPPPGASSTEAGAAPPIVIDETSAPVTMTPPRTKKPKAKT